MCSACVSQDGLDPIGTTMYVRISTYKVLRVHVWHFILVMITTVSSATDEFDDTVGSEDLLL